MPGSSNFIDVANSAETNPTAVPPDWSVDGEDMKQGAGLLFFAYGSSRTLDLFLCEATNAARSFRRHNPGIVIAIVTNNATVDFSVFNIHIEPRPDLLFAGEGRRADKVPRQWLTRLYYLAHSPFHITWALDSNVVSCTPGAAQAFLDAALQTELWDHHIASGNQNLKSNTLYPHNWNIVYRWTPQTSSLLRDWLLLQLRQGVATDDQSTLHMAEMRALSQVGAQLKVGVLAPSFGVAFQNIIQTDDRNLRLTALLRGPSHVLHSTNASHCAAVNMHAHRARQVLAERVEDTVRPRKFRLRTLLTASECSNAVEGVTDGDAFCKFDRLDIRLAEPEHVQSASGAASVAPQQEAKTGALMQSGTGAETDDERGDALSSEWPPVGVLPAAMERLSAFYMTKRCNDALCGNEGWRMHRRTPHPLGHERLSATSCQPALNKSVHYLDRHRLRCGPDRVLSSFGLSAAGCGLAERRHYTYSCLLLPAPSPHGGLARSNDAPASATPLARADVAVNASSREYTTTCALLHNASIEALAALRVRCPAGGLLQGFKIESSGCETANGHMRYRYSCAWPVGATAEAAGDVAAPRAADVEHSTVCVAPRSRAVEALDWHRVMCAAGTALTRFEFTAEGCQADVMTARTNARPMHYRYACAPLPGALERS